MHIVPTDVARATVVVESAHEQISPHERASGHSLLSLGARAAFLIVAPLIGLIADQWGLRPALAAGAALSIAAAGIARMRLGAPTRATPQTAAAL